MDALILFLLFFLARRRRTECKFEGMQQVLGTGSPAAPGRGLQHTGAWPNLGGEALRCGLRAPEPNEPGAERLRSPGAAGAGSGCERLPVSSGATVIVGYCHLPNCSKWPPPIINNSWNVAPRHVAEAGKLMNETPTRENLGSCLLSHYPRGPTINLPSF